MSTAGGETSEASEPFSHQQALVERGATVFVSDGCSACHSIDHDSDNGPALTRLAGHRETLLDGRRVLVDERFLREALRDPAANELKGYPARPMLSAISRLHLGEHPDDVRELAAFMEQIGPE